MRFFAGLVRRAVHWLGAATREPLLEMFQSVSLCCILFYRLLIGCCGPPFSCNKTKTFFYGHSADWKWNPQNSYPRLVSHWKLNTFFVVGASFSENFYGMKRVSLRTGLLLQSTRERLRSLLFIVCCRTAVGYYCTFEYRAVGNFLFPGCGALPEAEIGQFAREAEAALEK